MKWYEQLQKYIGKKVIVVEKGYIVYQDDLKGYDIWKVDRIELKDQGKDSELLMYPSNGQRTLEVVFQRDTGFGRTKRQKPKMAENQ